MVFAAFPCGRFCSHLHIFLCSRLIPVNFLNTRDSRPIPPSLTQPVLPHGNKKTRPLATPNILTLIPQGQNSPVSSVCCISSASPGVLRPPRRTCPSFDCPPDHLLLLKPPAPERVVNPFIARGERFLLFMSGIVTPYRCPRVPPFSHRSAQRSPAQHWSKPSPNSPPNPAPFQICVFILSPPMHPLVFMLTFPPPPFSTEVEETNLPSPPLEGEGAPGA